MFINGFAKIWIRSKNGMIYMHCVKSVRIRTFTGPYLITFGQIMEIYGVSLCIQSECGKVWNRKTPNTDTFHAVIIFVSKN